MSTPYTPDGTYPTFPIDLVDNGEVISFVSYMTGLFKKVINGVGHNKANKLDHTNGTATGLDLAGTTTLKEAAELTAEPGAVIEIPQDVILIINTLLAELSATTEIVATAGALLAGEWRMKAGSELRFLSGSLLKLNAGSSVEIASTDVQLAGKIVGASLSEISMLDGSLVSLLGQTKIGTIKYLTEGPHYLSDSVTDKRNYIAVAGPTADRILTLPQPLPWVAVTGYTSGDRVKNGGKIYQCDTNGTSAASGGPTGTAANIVDGSTRWDYIGEMPVDGSWFEVTVRLGASIFTTSLQREGAAGGDYVVVAGDGAAAPFASTNVHGTARVRFDGTNWRFAGGGGLAFYGVDF